MGPARALAAGALALALVAVPGAGPAATEPRSPRWSWPLQPPPRVAARFVAPAGPYAPGHRGVDLAAVVGQPVRAAGPGVVVFAGRVAGRGVVTVAHGDGLRTTYEPVSATVGVGEQVARAQVLGRVTAAPGHCLPGTCLHWGLRRAETYLDPLGLLGIAPTVRLLPIWWLRAARAGPPPASRSPPGSCRPAPTAAGSRGPARS